MSTSRTGIVEHLPAAPDICAACGNVFGCNAKAACEGSSRECWCSEIELSETARAEIAERFQGCLCRSCLLKFAEPHPV